MATALAIGLVSRRSRLRFDTAVGVLFAGTFAFGVMLFSTIDGYVTDLLGYLLGNVLGIGTGDLVQVAVLGALVLDRRPAPQGAPVRHVRPARRRRIGAAGGGLEYLLLALLGITIVVSIQAVGIIMVVAMLVTPAATAQLLVIGSAICRVAVAWRCRRGRGPVPQLLPEPGVGGVDRPRRDAVLRDRAGRVAAIRPDPTATQGQRPELRAVDTPSGGMSVASRV